MTNEKYLNHVTEAKLVDTLEHIQDLEGIFLDNGNPIDGFLLLKEYYDYIDSGKEDSLYVHFYERINDIINYLSRKKHHRPKLLRNFNEYWKKKD